MAKQTLNIGTNANDGTGDNLRSAMQKVNENFTDLYSAPGISTDTLTFAGNEITAVRSNDDIVFKPAGTGAVLFPAIMINDNNIEGTRSNEDINLLPSGTGSVVFGAISISGTTFSSSDSATININEGLVVDGTLSVSGATTFSGSVSAGSGTTIGNLTLADGSITDSSGAISFGNENLSTTGTLAAATGSTLGNLTLANGSITDSSGAITFNDENLSTTGTISGATGSTLGNLTLANGSITDSSGAISFGNENLSTTGTLAVGNVTMSSGSIVDSSGAISFGNENLTSTGTINSGTGSTIGNLTLANGSITDSSGAISFGDENLSTTGTLAVGNVTMSSGSIVDSSGAISFGNENLTSTGTINSGTGSTIGNLTLGNGSITDSSGAISFGNENLSTTGTLDVGNVTLSSGSIVDSSGAISFGNENLSSTGTINSGTGSTIGNLTLGNGSITDSSGAISFGNENLTTTGSVTSGTLTLAGASITDSSGEIDFGNENLTTTGTLDVSGLSTLGALTVTGATTFGGGGITIDNLILNDNTISSSSNADINLTPGGTGVVTIPNLTVDSNINITDNTIKTTVSNSDLQLSGGSGSGIVEIIPGLVTAAVTTVGNVDVTGTETITGQLDVDAVRIKDNTITTNASNANLEISANGSGKVIMTAPDIIGGTINNTVIGGSTPAAGTFTTLSTTESLTIDGITISDNTISTNASNANLELSGSGSGGVRISGFTFPTSDDTAGKFLTTNGLGVLSFATAGVSLSHSDLADATTTISSSATSVLNTFDKTVYRSAKYFISATDATNSRFELLEANVIHDGTTAYVTTYGSVSDYTTGLGTYTVGISGDDVQLKVTNITDNSIVFKFQRIAIDV